MEKYNGMISDSLMLHLTGNSNLDMSDLMRVNIFTLEAERVSKKIDPGLPEMLFVDEFCKEIISTSGFHALNNFCTVDVAGLRQIGEKVYAVATL